MLDFSVVFVAGLIAGAMNALAGGGSFVSFPVLVWAGLQPVAANASSTVALLPGALASAWAYRGELRPIGEVPFRRMLAISMIGGGLGALLLLSTPASLFKGVVPWLLLSACLMFIFGARLGVGLRERVHISQRAVLFAQAFLALYGGYFGGAVGIMALAVWGLVTPLSYKELNPAKVVLVGSMNLVAAVFFVAADVVRWRQTLIMLVAAVIGGYSGALLGRWLAPQHIRLTIICITIAMTVWYFLRR